MAATSAVHVMYENIKKTKCFYDVCSFNISYYSLDVHVSLRAPITNFETLKITIGHNPYGPKVWNIWPGNETYNIMNENLLLSNNHLT